MAKKVGDLDYELMHFPTTPLTVKEREYAIYDVLGVMAFIQEEIETYGSVVNIPMTKTGKVRLYCRNKCFSEENKKKYQITMSKLTLSGVEEYDMLKRAFQAGYTHANYLKSNEVFENVYSMDFTSSYPSVMVCEKMPMSKGEWIKVKSVEQIRNMSIDYYLIFNIQFENLKEKELVPDHYISYARCQGCKNVVTDNGRVISADRIQLTITSDDLEIIEKCYDMDNCTITIGKCIRYKLGYLPKVFIECVLDFYKDKTTLKDVEGFEAEYLLKKGMLNSCFGMSVTDIVCEEIGYDDEWIANDSNTEEAIKKYNESKSRFLFYPWGIAICSKARKNLWNGIVELGQDYIYSDTDSVKFINYEKHKEYFERYNKEVCVKMERSCRVNKLNIEYTRPKTVEGKEKPLGVWDNDGVYIRFKTLGAKRYLVEYFDKKENKVKIKSTIAGANKDKASAYIASQKDPFEFFTDKMTIDKEHSGRLIHTYIDTPMSFEVVDYLGNRYVGTELSGIHIEKSEYNLKLSPFYVHLLNSRVMQCV